MIHIKAEITKEVHVDKNGLMKTHPCNIGEWYGNDICKSVELVPPENLPPGEYKVSIIFESKDPA